MANELGINESLLLKVDKIVIPDVQCNQFLQDLHKSRDIKLTIDGMRDHILDHSRKYIEDYCRIYQIFLKASTVPEESLLHPKVPSGSWQKFKAISFNLHGKWNFQIINYLSKCPFIFLVQSIAAANPRSILKNVFTVEGIQEELYTMINHLPVQNLLSSYNNRHLNTLELQCTTPQLMILKRGLSRCSNWH